MSNDATFQRIVVLQPRSNPSFLHGIGCIVRDLLASGEQSTDELDAAVLA